MVAEWQSNILFHGVRTITGGAGDPVVLIAGWPETAEAWSELLVTLSKKHQFFALDPPGLGESSLSVDGYDTGTIGKIMAQAIHYELKDSTYHLVGHDIGAWIAYAWAAQFPENVKTLSILDARIPGLAPTLPFPLPRTANMNLFQFSFYALPELPEILTQGKERELLTWFFKSKVFNFDEFPKHKLEAYIRSYSDPGVMAWGFEYYRAVEESSRQNLEFAKTPLPMPVLALGGALTAGQTMVPLAQQFASNVSGGMINDCGHFLAEEQPEVLVERLLSFFAASVV